LQPSFGGYGAAVSATNAAVAHGTKELFLVSANVGTKSMTTTTSIETDPNEGCCDY
jgi:acyl CoA:acetate/3-ketoacid CoA transferase alpha subunit